MSKLKKYFLLFLILLISGLRFYKLGQLPSGINADEASIGYDAYSILKTGKDQWGDFLPLNYFKSFGDYKLPVHFYLTIPSILAFGLNEFSIRLPAALAGFLSVFLTYFLVYELFEKSQYKNYAPVLALLSSLLLAISPWHFVLSRTGHEISLSVFLVILGMLLFLKKNLLFFFVFFLGFYTYHTARVFILLFLPILFFLYRGSINKKSFKIYFLVYFLLFLLPFLLSFSSQAARVRVLQTTGIPKVGMINQINEKRGVCFEFLPNFLCRLFYNRLEVFGAEYLKNYLNHFSPFTLFTHGVQGVDTFSLAKRGLFYLFELPFVLIGGFYFFLKSKNPYKKLLALWLLLYPVPGSLTGFDNSRRMTLLLPLFQILGALGILISWQTLKQKAKTEFFKLICLSFFSILIIFSFSRFLTDFLKYNITNSKDFKNGFREMITFVRANEEQYEKIYISNYYDYAYIHYLFFTSFDPLEFQENIKREMVKKEFVGDWVKVARIGKIYFFDKLLWRQAPANSLFVVAPHDQDNLITKENQATRRKIKTIKNLNNEPVFEIIEIIR